MFSKMLDLAINAAGEWNAQLFRELKGRLTPRNFALIVLGALIGQAFLMVMFFTKLPTNPAPNQASYFQEYCLRTVNEVCKLDQNRHVITDWLHWRTDISIAISWVLGTVLVVGGVYFLANDLRREETRGTLNFVRLSPQSATSLFVGKLLGVPILIYLAAALILPLQLMLAPQGFGLLNMLVFDGLWLMIAALFYLGAMLLVTTTTMMPIFSTLIAWCLQSPMGMLMQFILSSNRSELVSTNNITWFYLPVLDNVTVGMLFMVFSSGLLANALWLMLCRRYLNSNTTLLSKQQSYLFNGVMQIWLIGWALPLSMSAPHVTKDILIAVGIAQLFFVLALILTITPRRSVLQEWCRRTDLRLSKGFSRWWPDLIWDDRSPAVVALAINLLIAVIVWVLFGLLRAAPVEFLPVAGLILLILFNCGMAAQISATYKLHKYLNRSMVMIVFVFQVLLLWIINSTIDDQYGAIKLLTKLLIEFMPIPLLMGLMWQRLQYLGQSETQKLFRAA
jgi:hypothetical protein